VTKTGPLLNNH